MKKKITVAALLTIALITAGCGKNTEETTASAVKEETNNTVENQSVNEEIQAEDTLSPKTGESQLGKTMAAMVIVGCMASVIYIVRKRELYEK